MWRSFTLPGCWFALFFACMSCTPSLVPRNGLVQGLVCGITAAIGYGLGLWAAAADGAGFFAHQPDASEVISGILGRRLLLVDRPRRTRRPALTATRLR
jgi:hypothetical protein